MVEHLPNGVGETIGSSVLQPNPDAVYRQGPTPVLPGTVHVLSALAGEGDRPVKPSSSTGVGGALDPERAPLTAAF
jgi:hypothetical protein